MNEDAELKPEQFKVVPGPVVAAQAVVQSRALWIRDRIGFGAFSTAFRHPNKNCMPGSVFELLPINIAPGAKHADAYEEWKQAFPAGLSAFGYRHMTPDQPFSAGSNRVRRHRRPSRARPFSALPAGLSAATSFPPSKRITRSFQRLRLSFLPPFHPIRNHVHNGRCSTNQAVAPVCEEKP